MQNAFTVTSNKLNFNAQELAQTRLAEVSLNKQLSKAQMQLASSTEQLAAAKDSLRQ